MYSYDVASLSRPPVSRSIPSMRPSYDAEHPSSATPIYDTLYSEYRRLFRALPGDRSDEESMRFTGFAVREPAGSRHELTPYPQHQTFQTWAGQTQGSPQFMPSQQSTGTQPAGGQQSAGSYNGGTGGGSVSVSSGGNGNNAGQFAAGAATGHGWVAAGYLAPAQPAGAAAGTTAGAAGAPGTGGRHRSMLSLPPGRVPGQG
ncbi:hypothetical protein [Kitasatospora sp. NPDC094015]|uniref:hypothetical protein n=1 Tax=Kitasatospora sp. NPDC094015 TaxID=3155205 RepID=UPI0033334C3E